MKIKRSSLVVFEVRDEEVVDMNAFFRGEIETVRLPRIRAISPKTLDWMQLTQQHVEILSRVPEEFVDSADALPPGLQEPLGQLIADGLIDCEEREAGADESSRSTCPEPPKWSPEAFFFHMSNRARESSIADSQSEPEDLAAKTSTAVSDAERFIETHGEPPPMFVSRGGETVTLPDAIASTELPRGSLFEILERRRTVRTFESSEPIPLEKFSTLMKYCFGCWGVHDIGGIFGTLHKTSPSGGSLHPIEAFPFVLGVDGLESGLYHYSVERHGVTLLSRVPRPELEQLLTASSQQQAFIAGAQVVVALVARFERNFWKYSRRSNTYNVIMKDAGHLSQTFSLVSTALGLGAFYSGAIHPKRLEEALGLAVGREAPIGFCGCGIPAAHDPTALPLSRFEPR